MDQPPEIPFKIYKASEIWAIIKDENFDYLPNERIIEIFFSYIVYDEIEYFYEIEAFFHVDHSNFNFNNINNTIANLIAHEQGTNIIRNAIDNYTKLMSNVSTNGNFVFYKYLNLGQYRFHLYKKKTLLIRVGMHDDNNEHDLYKDIFNLDLDLNINVEIELKKYYLLDYNNNFYEQFTICNSNNFINILLYYDEFAYNFINIYKAYTQIILYKFTQLETFIRNYFLTIGHIKKFNNHIHYSDIIALRIKNFKNLSEKNIENGENCDKLIKIVNFYRQKQYVEFIENGKQYFGKISKIPDDNDTLYTIVKIAEKILNNGSYTLSNIEDADAKVQKNDIAETKYLECKVDKNKELIVYEKKDDYIFFIIKYIQDIFFKKDDYYYINRETIIDDDNFVFYYIASFIEKDYTLKLESIFKRPFSSDSDPDEALKEFITKNQNNIFLFYFCTRRGLQNIYDDNVNKICSTLYNRKEALELIHTKDSDEE